MVYGRRRRGRHGRRGRRGRGGFGGGFGGGSCRVLRRKIGSAHGRRARGHALAMFAKVCSKGGRRRKFPRGMGRY